MSQDVHVATFYRFVAVSELPTLQRKWLSLGSAQGLRGTLLMAQEGVNATLTGELAALEHFAATVRADLGLTELEVKYSTAEAHNRVFHRFKVKIKPEIVTLGRPEVRPAEQTGVHVDAERWHALLDDPEVLVIDTRNEYEVAIGSFPGANQPHTTNFRDFPTYVERRLDAERTPKVAMFCTGGIRCEKASAFMLQAGFSEVYQLEGGILRYLETVDPEQNRWRGECFVFDQRVSVDSDLRQGRFEQCFACRHPLSAEDRASELYLEGESCPHCAETLSEAQRCAFRERRRQVVLAEQRGEQHLGTPQPVANEPDARG